MSVSTPGSLSCQELVELVTDYLEDALTADTRARFEHHIDECPSCGTYLDQMRFSIALTGRLAEGDLSPERRDALLDAFRDWKATETSDEPAWGVTDRPVRRLPSRSTRPENR